MEDHFRFVTAPYSAAVFPLKKRHRSIHLHCDVASDMGLRMVSSFYLSHWRVGFCSPLVCGILLIGTVSKHVTLFVPLLLSASNLSGRPAGRLTNTMPALLCTIVGQLCKWAGHFTMNTSLDLPATNPSS